MTHGTDDKLEAIILLTLLPSTFIVDFCIRKEGVHYRFIDEISRIQPQLTVFLSALREATDLYFYFEAINRHEAILKTYGEKKLEFSDKLISQAGCTSFEGGP